MSATENAVETVIERARCDGSERYRNGRKHLVALDRLISPHRKPLGHPGAIYATGPCPVCGACFNLDGYGSLGPAGRGGSYMLIGVKGTKMPKLCSASCRQSASAECKCSCGGADHGMHA